MKARFIGNGDRDPEALEWGGARFPRGEAVEVPPALADKIRGNGHFEIVKAPKARRKAQATEAEDGADRS